jgi:Fibronectin type III domain
LFVCIGCFSSFYAVFDSTSLGVLFAVHIGYVVEKCEEGSTFWEKVPGVVNGTAHMVRDLEPGKKYNFRVKAENMYGIGEPCETDRSILAKNPFGSCLWDFS